MCSTLVHMRCPVMSACASETSVRSQVHVEWSIYKRGEKKSVFLHLKKFNGGKKKFHSFTWIFSTGSTGSCRIVAFLPSKPYEHDSSSKEADTGRSVPISLILQEEAGGESASWAPNSGRLHCFINQVEALWKMFLFGCSHLFFGVNLRPVAGFCERKQWTVVSPPPPIVVAPVRRLRGWCRSVSAW